MITVTINLPDGKEFDLKPAQAHDPNEVLEAVKTLFPEWTSVTITVVKQLAARVK